MIGYSVGSGTQQLFKDSKGRIYVNAYVDGTLTDASGSVTVTVTDEAGATVINSQSATKESTGVYYYDLGISNTADVKKLYAVWTGTWESVSQKLRTNHEVMGFPLFTEAQARSFDISQLDSASDYPDATILEERAKITDLLEQWTGVSWTPKYNLVKMKGEKDRMISLPNFHINKLISVKILGETIATTNFEIDKGAGFIHRIDGSFPEPTSAYPLPIVVEYEYGWDYIRNGVDRIALKLLLDRIISSNIPDRATSFNDEIGNISLVTQGGNFKNPTRIPEVNQWIDENSEKVFGV
jgi:hypothetical protein|tara:strand:+ start:993 stop:1883 length:891 start_codon:yes stop_codon:yes gene_type:complete